MAFEKGLGDSRIQAGPHTTHCPWMLHDFYFHNEHCTRHVSTLGPDCLLIVYQCTLTDSPPPAVAGAASVCEYSSITL